MSLSRVAAVAGVSASTVSRVLNEQHGVAPDTAETVRVAMRKISFTPPAHRRARKGPNGQSEQAKTIGFLVLGTSGEQTAPAFANLLRGVSIGARENNFDLFVSFVSNLEELPRRISEQRVGGLLLHGEQPSKAVEAQLRGLPTVWLMANRFPPRWGDQVMPDNSSIGRSAAEYLHQKGCKSAAYLSASAPAWGLQVRELAFCQYLEDAGVRVQVLRAALESPQDFWQFDGSAARSLAERFVKLQPRPQGLFVAEDRHAPAVYSALAEAGVTLGNDGEVHLVSCNNEMPYLSRLRPAPATLDIRAESIGRRGVEQLIWRLKNANVVERIRKMVEPVLIEPS
ncbi:MAG: LacI family DNA-binding transcriptional regulator [Tepidisphaeraceae bacterium]|jgi:DNA-binding LacI/PurR family transcriptional regulator